MKRPILLLNLVLAAGLIAGGYELRRRWLLAREREAALLAIQPTAPAATWSTAAATPPPAKLQSSQYFEVAERFLFARDRNPNVIIEKKPEPPPKVMPNFPAVHGVMDIGMGPTVFITTGTDAQKGFKPGDKIGEFTLLAATQKDVTFEWEGKPITKLLDDLRPRLSEPQAPGDPRMNSNVNSGPPPAPPPVAPQNVRPAPGQDIGGGRKGCLPGDNSPSGTVAEGHRKVSTSYAFGPICYWEPIR